MTKPRKPLGRRAYGSIPHLPGSRLGPGDHHCHEGQARIATERVRDRHDRILVQEKLDGSCVAVAMVNGEVLALGRAGYLAETSPFEQHHMFAEWVAQHRRLFNVLLRDGERIVGEWLAQAHGTRYRLEHAPFVAFDIMQETERATFDEVWERLSNRVPLPTVIATEPMTSGAALERLGTYGYHGAVDPIEGAVWRVERRGQVDFLVKYVRPDKVDGCYLPEVSGRDAVWNWMPQEVPS